MLGVGAVKLISWNDNWPIRKRRISWNEIERGVDEVHWMIRFKIF